MASLVGFLYDSVRRAPRAEALVASARRIDYGELWRMVCGVTACLRGEGFTPGMRVGILLDNSPEYVAAYYGALGAGAVAVGLNHQAKARDLLNCLRHCDASWLVASARHPELAEIRQQLGHRLRLIVVGASESSPRALAWDEAVRTPAMPELAPDPLSVAAIIYTSGTTGQPKGVTLSHDNLASNVRAIVDYLRLQPSDRVLHVLPFYYSYGNSVLHTHLAAGACLVLEEGMVYPHRVLERMVEEGVTGFSGVPATFALLLNRTRLGDYDLSRLRYVTQAGGAMAPAQVARVRAALPHVEFFVMYGQTEATARISYLPPSMLDRKPGSVGIPLPGTEIAVRSPDGQPAAVGESGEIWVRGPHVMQGYWGDPDATAQVLVDGWLRTGDLGHVDEDGFLYIDGRLSDMIKTGAHRVSPQEIEEVVAEMVGVAEVAAIGVPDELMGQLIKVVVVPQPGYTLEVRDVLAHCRNYLPLYKIPKFVEFASELPRTASGKVQRFRLVAEPVPATGTGA